VVTRGTGGRVAATGEDAKHRENTKITGRNREKGKEGAPPPGKPHKVVEKPHKEVAAPNLGF
jgi:hypothetical protein